MNNKNHTKNRSRVNHSLPAANNQQVMRRKHSSDKTRCTVTFWLPKAAAPDARCVSVAGGFNSWCVDRHPMKRLKNGDFSLEIELEAGKEHQFRFVIDGVRWENAWNADKYVWCEHAQCENSVIVI